MRGVKTIKVQMVIRDDGSLIEYLVTKTTKSGDKKVAHSKASNWPDAVMETREALNEQGIDTSRKK